MPIIQPTLEEQLSQHILKQVELEITAAINSSIEAAKKELEMKVRGQVGKIAAQVLSHFSFERMGTDLVIRVKFDFKESNGTAKS